ncbi:MAG: DUF945 family protein [Pseudomonadota bacterium]
MPLFRFKPAYVAAAAFSLIVFLSPLVLGVVAEHRIQTGLNSIGSTEFVDSKVVFYSRGWLRSRVVSRLTLANSNFKFYLSHNIHHGPVWLSNNGTPNFGLATIGTSISAWQRPSSNSADDPEPIETKISLFGNSETIIAPFTFQSSEIGLSRVSLKANKIAGHNSTNLLDNTNQGWVEVRSVKITDNAFQATLIDGYSQFNVRIEPNETSARTHLKFDELSIATNNTNLQSAINWINVETNRDDDFILLKIEGTSGLVAVGEELFRDFTYDMSLSIPYQEQTSSLIAMEEKGTEDQISFVLPAGSVFSINQLSFENKGRKVNFWATLETSNYIVCCNQEAASVINKVSLDSEIIANEKIVYELLENRTRDIINRTDSFGEMITFSDAEAAPLIANSVASQLDVLQSQDYLDYDGTNYAARIALRNGQLTINGKPLLLSRFMR